MKSTPPPWERTSQAPRQQASRLSSAEFRDIAMQFCELVDIPPPDMPCDARGVQGMSIQLGGVDMSVLHDPTDHPGQLLVSVHFGAVPPEHELAALRDALEANRIMSLHGGPVFCRHAETGALTLQQLWPLDGANAEQLLAGLRTFASAALQWRGEGYRLESSVQDRAAAIEAHTSGLA